ncbi:hypothetical protein Tco_0630539 [Tanacetum coccineum]
MKVTIKRNEVEDTCCIGRSVTEWELLPVMTLDALLIRSLHFWLTSLMSKLGMVNLHSLGGVLASMEKGNRCCAATARGMEVKGLEVAILHLKASLQRLILDRLPYKLNLSSRDIDIHRSLVPLAMVTWNLQIIFSLSVTLPRTFGCLFVNGVIFLFLILLRMSIGNVDFLRGRFKSYYLPRLIPSVTMMTVEKKPDVTYNDVGGCKEQIENMREANSVTSDMASLPLVFLRSITDGLFGIDLTDSITIQIQFAT